jgi:hypothetical protein
MTSQPASLRRSACRCPEADSRMKKTVAAPGQLREKVSKFLAAHDPVGTDWIEFLRPGSTPARHGPPSPSVTAVSGCRNRCRLRSIALSPNPAHRPAPRRRTASASRPSRYRMAIGHRLHWARCNHRTLIGVQVEGLPTVRSPRRTIHLRRHLADSGCAITTDNVRLPGPSGTAHLRRRGPPTPLWPTDEHASYCRVVNKGRT